MKVKDRAKDIIISGGEIQNVILREQARSVGRLPDAEKEADDVARRVRLLGVGVARGCVQR